MPKTIQKIEFKTDTVEYLYKAGNDWVKETMPKSEAEKIVASGKPKEIKQNGFNVQVGDYYFKADIVKGGK